MPDNRNRTLKGNQKEGARDPQAACSMAEEPEREVPERQEAPAEGSCCACLGSHTHATLIICWGFFFVCLCLMMGNNFQAHFCIWNSQKHLRACVCVCECECVCAGPLTH